MKYADLYSTVAVRQLEFKAAEQRQSHDDNKPPSVGLTIIRYTVQAIADLSDLKYRRAYQVVCSQRVIIPNSAPLTQSPPITAYKTYPLLISNTVSIESKAILSNAGDESSRDSPSDHDSHLAELLDYSPRTINASVSRTSTQGHQLGKGVSLENSTGSTTSQSNNFGFSAHVNVHGSVSANDIGLVSGSAGGGVGAGAHLNIAHSHSDNRSESSGSSSNSGVSRGGSGSMSIKDWGCYSRVSSNDYTTLTWNWGQEFPWNVFRYQCDTANDNNVTLPQSVWDLLWDSTAGTAFPPSQLSQFGVDFTMKAAWQVALPRNLSGQKRKHLHLKHSIQLLHGSHGDLDSGSDSEKSDTYTPPTAELTSVSGEFNYTSPKIDLTLLGLDPILSPDTDNGAVIGFTAANRFLIAPEKGDEFLILSGSNNLQVTGDGFDTPMQTSFTQAPGKLPPGTARLCIEFKMTEEITPYSLILKHWVTTETACQLTLTFNRDWDNSITAFVDAQEGEGGEDNILSINLRNEDYSSVNYHNYLKPGLNRIDVKITPVDPVNDCAYSLRALAIGASA